MSSITCSLDVPTNTDETDTQGGRIRGAQEKKALIEKLREYFLRHTAPPPDV